MRLGLVLASRIRPYTAPRGLIYNTYEYSAHLRGYNPQDVLSRSLSHSTVPYPVRVQKPILVRVRYCTVQNLNEYDCTSTRNTVPYEYGITSTRTVLQCRLRTRTV